MRFCLLTTFFPPYHFGGDAVFVACLANALARDGHSVQVVHCTDAFTLTQGSVNLSPFPLEPSVEVHALRSSAGPLSPLVTFLSGEPGLKSRELRCILAQDFDVIHWHNISLVGGPGALEWGAGVKLCTLHDYWFLCPTHILFRNNEEACTVRTCFSCQLAYRRPPQPWRYTSLLHQSCRHIDRFLAPSRAVQKIYRDAPERIESTVLPHFVPGRAAVETVRGSHYLFVGRLEKAKGLQTVLPLFRRTGRELWIAGAGNYEGELRKLAADDPCIRFLGRVDYADLPALYAGARATICPSICYETFGLTVVESLRQGTPVITSDFGALPEVVADTGGGFIFRTESELEGILDEFDREPERARALGCAGMGNLAKYSVRAHLENYYRIIEEERQSR